MHARWIGAGVGVLVTVAAVGCKKTEEPSVGATSVSEAETGQPITKKAVEEEMAKSDDGPDCDTFVSEVKQACRDHYQKGLDIDCNSHLTAANGAVKQRSGGLFKDPSGKRPAAASKAGERMCAMMGKRLREAVAKAESHAPAASCTKLGTFLDSHCFDKIGTPEYDVRCSGTIIATRKTDSDPTCSGQLTAAKAMIK